MNWRLYGLLAIFCLCLGGAVANIVLTLWDTASDVQQIKKLVAEIYKATSIGKIPKGRQ